MPERTLHLIKNHFEPWLAGVKDALCFHRCIVYFVHEHEILVKLGHTLSLNGGIFLGSIALWNLVVCPITNWILLQSIDTATEDPFLHWSKNILATIFTLAWLLPIYLVTFPLSCMWYQEIAQLAHNSSEARGKDQTGLNPKSLKTKDGPKTQPDVFTQLAQELYRVVLFGVFYLQTLIAGALPIIGVPIGFIMLSWLNALYSFDYKWSLSQKTLEQRVHYFELHWAFFAGFGSVCTLFAYLWTFVSQRLNLFWPIFSDAAFLAVLYPLFILIASDASPNKKLPPEKPSGDGNKAAKLEVPVHLPIFQISISITSWIIDRCPDLIQLPSFFWKHRWKLIIICLSFFVLPSVAYYVGLAK